MLLSRAILTMLIILQAAAGGFGSGSRVVCFGTDGHIAIERTHPQGHCEHQAPRPCRAHDDHAHADREELPCEHEDDCEDVQLLDLDLAREAPVACQVFASGAYPCVGSLVTPQRETTISRASAVRIVDPPPLRTERAVLRATVLII